MRDYLASVGKNSQASQALIVNIEEPARGLIAMRSMSMIEHISLAIKLRTALVTAKRQLQRLTKGRGIVLIIICLACAVLQSSRQCTMYDAAFVSCRNLWFCGFSDREGILILIGTPCSSFEKIYHFWIAQIGGNRCNIEDFSPRGRKILIFIGSILFVWSCESTWRSQKFKMPQHIWVCFSLSRGFLGFLWFAFCLLSKYTATYMGLLNAFPR